MFYCIFMTQFSKSCESVYEVAPFYKFDFLSFPDQTGFQGIFSLPKKEKLIKPLKKRDEERERVSIIG